MSENGVLFDWLFTTAGVPQGSVLDPLLISSFIVDIRDRLRYATGSVFADDTQIYLSVPFSKLTEGLAQIAYDVNVISEYAATNELSLNLSKAKILILGSNTYVNRIKLSDLPPVSVGGISLPYVTEERSLSVVLQNDLSWRKCVSLISRKVHGTLHAVKFHKNALSTEVKIKLFTALTLTHLEYCCLVYHGLSDELNIRLQRLVNCGIRFIYDLRRDVHVTPYRQRLGWLSVENRRLYFLGVMSYRVSRESVPSYISDLFSSPTVDLRRSSRLPAASSVFHIPLHRTTAYRNSFLFSAAYFWNSLPSDITSAPSLAKFKARLMSHIRLRELPVP